MPVSYERGTPVRWLDLAQSCQPWGVVVWVSGLITSERYRTRGLLLVFATLLSQLKGGDIAKSLQGYLAHKKTPTPLGLP